MRYGLDVPNLGGLGYARQLVDLARDAEEAGWDGFFVWDSLYSPVWDDGLREAGLDDKRAVADPWVALAAVATATSRIRIGTMVTPPARRRPWKLARETVTLDHLSDGRLTLPVGLGAPDDGGFASVGEELDRRVRAELLDESLEILAGLWSGKPFSFQGQHYRLEEMTFLPTPAQSPRIPIWVVGAWPRPKSMRRALRWDGVLPAKMSPEGDFVEMTPGDVRELSGFIAEHRQTAGPFDVVVELETSGDDPAQVAAVVREYAEAGATWCLEGFVTVLQERGLRGVWERVRQGPPRID